MQHAGGRRLEDWRELRAEHEVLGGVGLEGGAGCGDGGGLAEAAWQPYRTPAGIATDREIAATVHSMNGTEQAFRLIVLRWANPQPNLFAADRYC
jgi:hypothetical protein